jgi:hypothetical protein
MVSSPEVRRVPRICATPTSEGAGKDAEEQGLGGVLRRKNKTYPGDVFADSVFLAGDSLFGRVNVGERRRGERSGGEGRRPSGQGSTDGKFTPATRHT